MTAKHMVSQNTRRRCRLVKSMNVFEEEEKKIVPFSFVKAKTKERKQNFAMNRQQTPVRAAKAFFYNQNEWLQEIEEDAERKSDSSEN